MTQGNYKMMYGVKNGKCALCGCAMAVGSPIVYNVVAHKAACVECWNKAHPDNKWVAPVSRPKFEVVNFVITDEGVFYAKYDYKGRQYNRRPLPRELGEILVKAIPALVEAGEKLTAKIENQTKGQPEKVAAEGKWHGEDEINAL